MREPAVGDLAHPGRRPLQQGQSPGPHRAGRAARRGTPPGTPRRPGPAPGPGEATRPALQLPGRLPAHAGQIPGDEGVEGLVQRRREARLVDRLQQQMIGAKGQIEGGIAPRGALGIHQERAARADEDIFGAHVPVDHGAPRRFRPPGQLLQCGPVAGVALGGDAKVGVQPHGLEQVAGVEHATPALSPDRSGVIPAIRRSSSAATETSTWPRATGSSISGWVAGSNQRRTSTRSSVAKPMTGQTASGMTSPAAASQAASKPVRRVGAVQVAATRSRPNARFTQTGPPGRSARQCPTTHPRPPARPLLAGRGRRGPGGPARTAVSGQRRRHATCFWAQASIKSATAVRAVAGFRR